MPDANQQSRPYRGRFAPSPSGDLHFGSLVAAVASFADARKAGGEWLVRIDDVDETRTRPGAAARILGTLQAFGMTSDEPPQYQSERKVRYSLALERLKETAAVYPCVCSRKQLAESATMGRDGPVYAGTCRMNPPVAPQSAAWRLRVGALRIAVRDRVFGALQQDLATEIGDFVVYRRDGFCAYHLAVVLDDADQGITDVVRGADLLWSTPRQIALQRMLDLAPVRYAHVPLVYDESGRKLSKRDAARPVDDDAPLPALLAAWRHLRQVDLPARLRSPADFWQVAVPQWSVERMKTAVAGGHEDYTL
jgi:glutamyl-Q tRNA(Asp) synthetase